MKRVAFGILAVLLGAGCAVEAGDPGGTSQPPPTVSQATTMDDQPDPSPWDPKNIPPTINPPVSPSAARKASRTISKTDSDQGSDPSANQTPEPAPWNGESAPLEPPSEDSTQQPGNSGENAGVRTGGVYVIGTVQLMGNWTGHSTAP
jgi:hypothetical protein